jgi:uncharacterized membrane protein YsdA (DUF1294 family)
MPLAPQRKRPSPRRGDSPAPWTIPRVLVLPAFAVLYGYVVMHGSCHPKVAIAYGALSVAAFIAYAVDKSAAINGRWRMSDNSLHLLGLAGGWPGALLAQQWLRHKTAKRSFICAFWATVIANSAGFYVLCAAPGAGLRL